MITTKNWEKITFILLVSVLTLFACGPDTVRQIRITPTPDLDAVSTMPTEAATQTPTATPSPTPTLTPTATQTHTPPPVTPTASDEPSPEPAETRAQPTFLGPIVGPGYERPTLEQPTIGIPTITPAPLETGTPRPGLESIEIPNLDADVMGVQVYSQTDFADFEEAVRLAAATGVTWTKIQVNWNFLQGEGKNQLNDAMQLFERQVELATRPEGMRVILSIAKAPAWTRSDTTEDGPPDDPQELADFITFMLNETKIGQSIDAIEIWNEPNLQREWRGTLPFSGGGYMRLFEPSYRAIRAYSPDIVIITAGLAPTSNLNGAVDDQVFLQQMYDAGLANYADVVIGVHPYGWGNPPDATCCGEANSEPGWDDNPHFFFKENIDTVWDIMQRNGHNTQMWLTEFGWSSWEGFPVGAPEAWHTYTTALEQAEYALRAFQIGQELPQIGVMILWNLNFANETTVNRGDEITGFSIINPLLTPRERPLYWALSIATGALEQ